MKITVYNRKRQGITLHTKDALGKSVSRLLPSMGKLELDEHEMSQDVLDKEKAGYVKVETAHEAPAEA